MRSPYPLAVHCTWVTPLSTAVNVLATAHPVSSWQWMPRRPWTALRTSETTFPIPVGSMPPFVSHMTTTSAPAAKAARITDNA